MATYSIFCLVHPPNTNADADINELQAIGIKIASTETVGDLARLVKTDEPATLSALNLIALNLYQVDASDNATAISRCQPANKLAFKTKLNKIYTSGPPDGMTHIVVKVPVPSHPAGHPADRKRKREDSPTEAETPSKRVQADHNHAMAVALAKDVPSKAAKSANLIKQQKENPIRIGRPHDTCGPPITIYERVFADFRRNMSEGQEDLLSPTDYEAVGTLLVSLSAVYREKKERQAVLTLILGKLLNQSIDVVQLEDGTSNDGICTVHVGGGYSALLLLCEFKNEPCLQASFSFTRWWSQDRAAKCRDSSFCATFLLAIDGPWVSVHGGALIGEDWVVQPLTDLMWAGITPDLELDDQMQRVARLFHNLKIRLVTLATRFKDQAENPKPLLPFPYLTSYTTITEPPTLVEFVYKERIHCSGARNTTAIFLAEETGNKPRFVKFTSRYNINAHRLLAENKLAPQVYGFEKLAFGHFMVVMEYIVGHSMIGSNFTTDDLNRVQKAAGILHQHNIVFGDLRPNNIIKPEDGPGVFLVDFDWCGSHEESRYPVTLNSDSDCGWHSDVQRGAIMRKEHDDHLLQRLRSV